MFLLCQVQVDKGDGTEEAPAIVPDGEGQSEPAQGEAPQGEAVEGGGGDGNGEGGGDGNGGGDGGEGGGDGPHPEGEDEEKEEDEEEEKEKDPHLPATPAGEESSSEPEWRAKGYFADDIIQKRDIFFSPPQGFFFLICSVFRPLHLSCHFPSMLHAICGIWELEPFILRVICRILELNLPC